MAASIVPPIDLTASVDPTLIRTLFWTAAATAGIDMGAGSSVFFRDGDLVLGAAAMVGTERLRIVGDTRSEGDINLVENDLTDIGELLDVGGTFDMRVSADTTFTTARINDRQFEILPIDMTWVVGAPNLGMIIWDSTIVTTFANATLGGVLFAIGEIEFQSTGLPVNAGLLFNNGTTFRKTTAAGIMGSFFTFIGQGNYIADGVAATLIVHRDFLSQPNYSVVGIGTLTVGERTNFHASGNVGTGVTLTTWVHFLSIDPVTKTGTITTEIGLDVGSMAGAGTKIGIRSDIVATASSFNIQVTGTAISTFAGDVHVNDLVSFVVGTPGGSNVELLRPGAAVLRMIGVGGAFNEGLDWDFQNSNNVAITSPTTAGINFDTIEIAFGPGVVADGANNFVFAFSPGLRSTELAGSYAEVLFTSSSSLAIANVITTLSTWEINAVVGSIVGGSVVDGTVVVVQGNVNFGTNRYGVLITSAPAGGGGNNQPFRVEVGESSVFDLEVRGAAVITGKLTVGGAIDPTSVLLSGGTALFYESNDGSTAGLSGGATGRIRYNDGTGAWQASTQGGAYADFAVGAASPWQTTANVTNLVTGTDTVTIGSAVALAKLAVDGDANEVQFLVQGFSTQTTNLVVFETSAGTDIMAVSGAGNFTFTQQVQTTGSPTAWTFVGAAHTTLTASVESIDMNINLSRTVQFATGALATQRAILIQAPVYAFVAASVITFAATMEITGAPAEGAFATITEGVAMNIAAGGIRVAGPQVWVETSPAQFVADQNNLVISENTVQRMSTDASRTITGIVAPPNTRFLIIINVGSNPLVLANQNASSAASARFITGLGGNQTVGADDSALLWYDISTARWRVIA